MYIAHGAIAVFHVYLAIFEIVFTFHSLMRASKHMIFIFLINNSFSLMFLHLATIPSSVIDFAWKSAGQNLELVSSIPSSRPSFFSFQPPELTSEISWGWKPDRSFVRKGGNLVIRVLALLKKTLDDSYLLIFTFSLFTFYYDELLLV